MSYANVVATLALVFAMSGGALAAKHYLINSTNQINPKVLKKLKGNTGKPGSIGPQGTAGAQGGVGAQGPKGAQGPEGERGPPGQARAYATIVPGEPGTIRADSRGVVGATTFGGITCVFLEPSIDLETAVAIVSSHFGDRTFSAAPGSCSVKGRMGVQVNGFNQNGTSNATEAFSLIVP